MKAYSYIRFSSPEQLKGDSLRRQLDLSEQYAKEKGLTLDTSLNLQDLGLSAFHGTHKTKGALGQFLKLVEAGRIEPGSVLIVENLDRLSREKILTALTQFTGIIEAGIKLVTLQDRMEYSQESIDKNWAQLIISITYMARAHEESKTKSERIKKAWDNKRNLITSTNLKMTRISPFWVKLSKDRKEFTLIPEVCKSIEIIYRMRLSGKGVKAIITTMNQNNLWKPPPSNASKSGGWNGHYVKKLLKYRSIIGEFQSHETVEGKYVKKGDPISNYYPPAIDKDLYYEVQKVIEANSKLAGQGGGQTGKANNLFQHIVKCGLCGSSMHFHDKGKPPKGAKYLYCDAARRKMGCTSRMIRYEEFEKMFFMDFDEFDVSLFTPDKDKRQTEINHLKKEIGVLEFEVLEFERKLKKIRKLLLGDNDDEEDAYYMGQINEFKQEKNRSISSLEVLQSKLKELESNGSMMRTNIDVLKTVYKLLDTTKDSEKLKDIRLRLRVHIQNIVSRIDIYPLEEKYVPVQEIEPGVFKNMNSKYIRKVRIKFNNTKTVRLLLGTGFSTI